MDEYLKKVFTQISEFVRSLSPARKFGMVATFVAIVAGFVGLFIWAGNTTFSTLMTNLNGEDQANIIRILREKRIPFKVDTTGKNISIPPESVDQLRLELATMGLPQSSTVGYEVFDKQSLGTTSFVQKINQKRALEGELMRTVTTIKGVRHARVHLALPQKSTFVEDQKRPTGSVVLDLEPGTVLDERQIFGVGNLVARAVEGMEVADVVIMDSQGKVLSKNASDPLAAATASHLEFQQRMENELENRIETLLSRVVGDGRVVAKVAADLDFSQVAETQTLYDADGSAVHSVEKRNENMNGSRPGAYGLSGSASNQPGQPPAANNEIKTDTTKINEVTNYEVPQTVRHTTQPSGTIKRLSVAVVVDGKTVKSVGKDGVAQSKVEAWAPEKIKEFEDIIASAVGIDKKRGDILEIRNMEFSREDFDEAARMLAEKEHKAYLQNLAVTICIGLIAALFFLFVVRPFVKWMTENTIDSVDTFLPQTIEELERMQKNSTLPGMEDSAPVLPDKMDPEKIEGEVIKEKITTLVDANPHKAALILRDWLHLDAKKKAGDPVLPGGKEPPGAGVGGKARSATA